MHHFAYKTGVLFAEDVDLRVIARQVGTPFYCYSTATLTRHYRVFEAAFATCDAMICYAMKANSNQGVIATLAQLGAGMDVVSEGEMRRAVAAGVPAHKITFSGVGKTAGEIAYALEQDIFCFNVESEPELLQISRIARERGGQARVSIRVNPDVDAQTHHKISTGKSENKFGVPISQARDLYRQAAALPGVRVTGVDMHIGSQITTLEPFERAFAMMNTFVEVLRADGHNIEHVDLGGGLGIPYHDRDDPAAYHPNRYAEVVMRHLGGIDCKFVFEPGRMLAGNSGLLVTEVLYIKSGEGRTFVIVDAAMNDLIRPTLYEAHHEILPVEIGARERGVGMADVVGPVCETGDYFALRRLLPEFEPGELLAIMSAGAYGAVQANTYNSRLLVPEVMVNGSDWAVVRPRPSYEEMIGLDRMPFWLA